MIMMLHQFVIHAFVKLNSKGNVTGMTFDNPFKGTIYYSDRDPLKFVIFTDEAGVTDWSIIPWGKRYGEVDIEPAGVRMMNDEDMFFYFNGTNGQFSCGNVGKIVSFCQRYGQQTCLDGVRVLMDIDPVVAPVFTEQMNITEINNAYEKGV